MRGLDTFFPFFIHCIINNTNIYINYDKYVHTLNLCVSDY